MLPTLVEAHVELTDVKRLDNYISPFPPWLNYTHGGFIFMRRMIPQNKIEVLDHFNYELENELMEKITITLNPEKSAQDPTPDEHIVINALGTITGPANDGVAFGRDIGGLTPVYTIEPTDEPGLYPQVYFNANGYVQIYAGNGNGMPIAEFYSDNNNNPVMGIGGQDNEITANLEEGSLSIYNTGDILLDTEMNLVFSNNIVDIIIQRIRTSDPHIAGALWNDNGTLKISSGN